MKKTLTLTFALLSFCNASAGIILTAGAGWDNVKEKFQTTSHENTAGNPDHKGLNALVGVGYELQPTESISLPITFEARYSAVKNYAKNAVVSDNTRLSGALMIRPTFNLGWIGVYGAAGYANIDLKDVLKGHVLKAKLNDQLSNLVYGGGVMFKLDHSLDFYAEFIQNANSAKGSYNTTVNGAQVTGDLYLRRQNIMVGVRYHMS